MTQLREKYPEKTKKDQANRKRLSMSKKRGEDNKKVKHDQNQWQADHRHVENAMDRLKEFKDATLFNAIFICTCCHQRMFQSNVQFFTDNIKEKINSKAPGLIQKGTLTDVFKTTTGKLVFWDA